MMLHVVAIFFAAILTLAVPPLAIVTIPLGIVYAARMKRRVAELRRKREVFLTYTENQARLKNLRSW